MIMNLYDDEVNKRPSFLHRFQVELPEAIVALSEAPVVPVGYQPSQFDVISGRGRGCYNQAGNKFMRDLCKKMVSKYQAATSKLDKSLILSEIVEEVKRQNNGTAQFVKHHKELGWIVLSDEMARAKVGHALREVIAADSNDRDWRSAFRQLKAEVLTDNLGADCLDQIWDELDPLPF